MDALVKKPQLRGKLPNAMRVAAAIRWNGGAEADILLHTSEQEYLLRRLSLSKAFLLAAFCALQIADVITTRHVLGKGGWEANPLGVFVMGQLGDYWPIPKLALMAVCAVVMIRWKPIYVIPFVTLMGLAVANNAFWAYL